MRNYVIVRQLCMRNYIIVVPICRNCSEVNNSFQSMEAASTC